MTHRFACRVYYEDTDLAGIVYYANYLRFIERARSEMIEGLGLDQAALKQDGGLVFAVRRLEADYLVPARFGDRLIVASRILGASGARLKMEQDVLRGEETLFRALVTLACLREDGRPARLPAALHAHVT